MISAQERFSSGFADYVVRNVQAQEISLKREISSGSAGYWHQRPKKPQFRQAGEASKTRRGWRVARVVVLGINGFHFY